MKYLKPARGMWIPHPENVDQPIGVDGAFVPDARQYRRYVKRGEAEFTKPPAKKTAQKSAEKEA